MKFSEQFHALMEHLDLENRQLYSTWGAVNGMLGEPVVLHSAGKDSFIHVLETHLSATERDLLWHTLYLIKDALQCPQETAWHVRYLLSERSVRIYFDNRDDRALPSTRVEQVVGFPVAELDDVIDERAQLLGR